MISTRRGQLNLVLAALGALTVAGCLFIDRSLAVSLGAAALALFASCTTATKENNHWLVESVGPRITFHFLGYEPAEDGQKEE